MDKLVKVYLGGSIAGGRDFEDGIKLISDTLEDLGCSVVTKMNVVENERKLTTPKTLKDRQHIMSRDKEWLRGSNLFIAEVSQYSHGVGYEHSYAESINKPVLLLRHSSLKDKPYSAFIDGTDYSNFEFSFYDENNIRLILKKFIKKYVK